MRSMEKSFGKGTIQSVEKLSDGTALKISIAQYLTAGGRVLGVTCIGDTLELALGAAYKAVKNISFTDMHYRHDIGKKALSPEKF